MREGEEERHLCPWSLCRPRPPVDGVSHGHAFSIDEVNLYNKLGHETFVKLSTEFYSRVYADDDETFRSIFANFNKEDVIQNQYEFLIQRMGGPQLYSQRKGHPTLIKRHRPFSITMQGAERWLEHMQGALDSVEEIDTDSKDRMLNFFRHTALLLVAGKQSMTSTNQASQGD